MSKIVPNSPDSPGGDEVILNSSPSSKKQISTAKYWCFTFNNYKEEQIVPIVDIFKKECEKFIIGREIGESGTPHLQGYIHLKKRMRPTELKLPKQIHFENAKGTAEQNYKYCSKDNNFICEGFPKPIKIITELRPFQKQIVDMILLEPNNREIIWVWESSGNTGKSELCKYLIVKHSAIFIDEGKKCDLMNLIFNADMDKSNLVVVDIPRDNQNISYKSLEAIKNGMVCNTKYETGSKIFNAPHIVVFSNFLPDTSKFSKDRWKIFEIVNMDLKIVEIDFENPGGIGQGFDD